MIRKYETLERIEKEGVIAVLRSESEDAALDVARACVSGGVNLIEITFSVPAADQVIRALHKSDDSRTAIIGAGTVIDETTARLAILAGAEFVVGPTFNVGVAMTCNQYGIPYIPGCMTVTEMTEAMRYGADIVKLFPASEFSPSMIKAVKAPLPNLNVMVTGGINVANTAEWIAAGAIAVGVGGNLTRLDSTARDPLAKIAETAAAYRSRVAEGRR